MDKILTIPNQKALSKADELVLVPKKEYQKLLEKQPKFISVEKLTAYEKKTISKSRKELARGEYITLDKLIHELASSHTKKH